MYTIRNYKEKLSTKVRMIVNKIKLLSKHRFALPIVGCLVVGCCLVGGVIWATVSPTPLDENNASLLADSDKADKKDSKQEPKENKQEEKKRVYQILKNPKINKI